MTNIEKASISELLSIIAQDHQLNKKAMNLPLYYIPKPTHTLRDILNASTDIINGKAIDSPLHNALHKTSLLIIRPQDIANRTKKGTKYIVLNASSIPQANPQDTYLIELPNKA